MTKNLWFGSSFPFFSSIWPRAMRLSGLPASFSLCFHLFSLLVFFFSSPFPPAPCRGYRFASSSGCLRLREGREPVCSFVLLCVFAISSPGFFLVSVDTMCESVANM